MKQNTEKHYNPAQETAIRHGAGPCAVIAGPGSGKTHVLVERIRHLTADLRIRPSSILVLTFSRAAAAQMRSRYLEKDGAPEVVFGTFHAVFYRILQDSSHSSPRLISAAEKRNYLQYLCRVCPGFPVAASDGYSGKTDRFPAAASGGYYGKTDRFPAAASGGFSGKTARLPEKTTPEELQHLISRHKNGLPCREAWLPGLVDVYDAYLSGKGCLDFDDMILQCGELLRGSPELLSLWRDRFQWILVDEFQDVSPSQYALLRLLAAPRNNLFIVGDDDQSIYGFRGADPLTMRRFLSDYGLSDYSLKTASPEDPAGSSAPKAPGIPEAFSGKQPCAPGADAPGNGVVFLTTNYRCARAVLRAAALLIRDNSSRIRKAFTAGNPEKGQFALRPFTDRSAQYAYIAGELSAMNPQALDHTAVIFRTHASAVRFLRLLEKNGICFVAEGTRAYIRKMPSSRSKLLSDIAAYYRCALRMEPEGVQAGSRASENRSFRQDMLRIMNRPERCLSGRFLSCDRNDRQSLLECAGFERDAAAEFFEDLRLLTALSPVWSLRYLLDSIGYRGYAEKTDPEAGMILEQLSQEAARTQAAPQWLSRLETLLAEVPENPDENRKPAREGSAFADASGPRGVHVLTMHACKGLEFDTVFIPDLNEGNIPSRKAWSTEETEEERRLFYVAMTRARQSLTITYLEGTPDRPAAPSRFLRPLLTGLP
ncbi:MAG: ATP-dependent helicase [Eubacteriales bacterium]|nr:ATP-dependent helicase [Eubacteriales bacterium]